MHFSKKRGITIDITNVYRRLPTFTFAFTVLDIDIYRFIEIVNG